LKHIVEGPQKIVYVVSDNNNFGWIDYSHDRGIRFPPFIFPGLQQIDIRKIWIDASGDLFVGTANDTLYIIKEATKVYNEKREWVFKVDTTNDGSWIIKEGSKKIEKIFLGKDIIVNSFYGEELGGDIFIGTNRGLFQFDKTSKEILDIFKVEKKEPVTITAISTESGTPIDKIWFSTLEKGMGVYSDIFNSIEYFPYKKESYSNPVKTFTRLSKNEFIVAILDSLPAIFNTETGTYTFIQDTAFRKTKNRTTNINIGIGGLLLVEKDNGLFISKTFLNNRPTNVNSGYSIGPTLKEISIQGVSYKEKKKYEGRYDSLKSIFLKYNENSIGIWFGTRGLSSSDTVMYAFKLDGYSIDWGELRYSFLSDKLNGVNFNDLKPGKYVFRLKVKRGNKDWLKQEISLPIIIESPFWQTWWFWLTVLGGVSVITYIIAGLRVKTVRKQEREKAKHEKELLEMEARALRAQMNPHFIFNCLNSIKSLIQQHEEKKSVSYLTTFSKLIRTLFNNADKKEISLHDEIETCKLYLQLEAMRFDAKFSYAVNVDENTDLKSIQVPALIIQPFIENAIWHGIVPRKSSGHISLNVVKKYSVIEIIIDDDGIGRESSQQNKSTSGLAHQSKGVNLTQSRLELNNLLQQRQATLEVVDKKDENGIGTGTKVIISIKEEI
jgi:anti-sigma regulatory factor (Ser/Thr protein kinase)